MPLIISGITLPFQDPVEDAIEKAKKIAGVSKPEKAYVVKRAVDARKQRDIRFVYSIALATENAADIAARANRPDVTFKTEQTLTLNRGGTRLSAPPVIAGFGPAGMFAALVLAREGLRPVILERGADMDTRVAQVNAFWTTGALHPDSNVQFGEGGAGTFSDGKLVTRIGDPRCRFVLEELIRHGAPEEIRWQAKPHVGTDRLRGIVTSIREEILRLGGEIHFQTPLAGLDVPDGKVASVSTEGGDFPAQAVILAPGHSARDLFALLASTNIAMEPKAFSAGVRIEHLQQEVDAALYGDLAGHPLLPRGEYQLSHREGSRAVYTFCMCPGGLVVPATSETGMVVTNGMSYHARDGINANAALVVSVDPADFGRGVLDGVEFQRRLEATAFLAGGRNYQAPAQTAGRFLTGTHGMDEGRVQPTYARGVTPANLEEILPGFITEQLRNGLRRFGRRQRGFDAPDALLTGVETRTSSPVRILRGEDGASPSAEGLYPCGEGAGYAGGIVSAAVDGVRAAQSLLARWGG